MSDFEMAKDKVLMGPERRSMIMTEKREAEHRRPRGRARAGRQAAAGLATRSTRSPSSRAAGRWASPSSCPPRTGSTCPSDAANDQIAMAMGGRIAEELIFDEMTTGAANDIERRDRPGARDGLRLGHEREARAAALRQARGRGLPGPRLRRREQGLLRGDRASRSTPRSARSSPRNYERAKKVVDRERRQAEGARRGAARVRDHRRRRDRPDLRGQAAGSEAVDRTAPSPRRRRRRPRRPRPSIFAPPRPVPDKA